MDTLLQDLRYACRLLINKPAFTGIAVVTLALGIGANTAIFSVVNSVLLRPLPYRDADRLVMVYEKKEGNFYDSVSFPDFTDFKSQNQSFEQMAAVSPPWTLWNNEKNMGAGQFAIDYGRPVWRKEYEETGNFDKMTKGKVYRLGSNFWTTLDSDMPLTIAGKTIPEGSWYLGLHRSEDGATWSLVFIDPAKARAAHIDASEIERAPIAHKAPMTVEQAAESKDKLTIDLVFQKGNLKDVTLKIAWGKMQLSAPIQVPISAS